MFHILILSLFFNFSYLPDWDIYYGINDTEIKKLELYHAYQVEFEVDFYFVNLFFIKGSINNIFHKVKNQLSFFPDCDQYRFGCGIRIKKLEIGYEHLCFHPIFPFGTELKNISLVEGGYNKIYIEFNTQLKIY